MNTFHPNIWHPFTIQKGALTPLKVKKGDGLWLELDDGQRIMDCISSWWVNLYGHAHPRIADAIARQARELEQVIFANFTHDPAEKLAQSLAELLPGSLNRVFFSDNGSTAVEVAMKMGYQYWKNKGEDRKTFICFEGAYHGDTFGAMSAGARSIFTQVFKELLFDVEFVPYPHTWMGDETIGETEDKVLRQLEQLLSEQPETYAGIMIEPLVQGAGGMRMGRDVFIRELEALCERHGTLLIFDEVMTGFGRTGARFAAERAGVVPDLICLSKGLTGGFLPLSVTVCTDEVYEVFHSADPMKAFWHGHSYTANPLGCAAANASFALLDEYEEVFRGMERWHRDHMEQLKEHPRVKMPRVSGTISAMNVDTGADDSSYLSDIGAFFKTRSVEEGVLLRPLGNVLYLMPPYCTSREELARMYEVIIMLLDEL